MPPRNLNVILLAISLAILCYVTHRRTRTALMVGSALDLIRSHYVDPIDDDELLTSAMNGMTGMLDENSSYIPGSAYGAFQDSINQEFAGIGIFVEKPEPGEPVRVITPLVGSPALKAGLLPGDSIVAVDDEDVSEMSLVDVSERLRGPVDTAVKLEVVRNEGEKVSVSVTRQTIELESVIGDHRDENSKWVFRLKEDPTIAYMRLTSFGEKTVEELRGVLKNLDNEYEGLVLDLRGNSGGLLYAAVDVCNMFLNQGRIVSTRIRGNVVEEVFDAEAGTLVDPGKRVAVLVDGNSASASEIVAACLQDNDRAVVVGTRSYGKGTVQNILPLQYGRSALRLTVARYYRPNDKNIHRMPDATDEDEWGVTPDEGNVVPVDEKQLTVLMRRWQKASYPMLASSLSEDIAGELQDKSGPGDDAAKELADAEIVATDEPELDDMLPLKAEVESGLSIDPQLERAVESLRDTKQATRLAA